MIRLPLLWRWGVLLLVVVPVCAWFFVKPVRVLAPGLVAMACPTDTVCVDDPARYQVAAVLHADAVAFVSRTIAHLDKQPKVIFCSTDRCAQTFGLGARSAVTLGRWGTVIGPQAWLPYYVRHEMIHHLQAERIGVIQLLLEPSWWVEGMAYALSQDPRVPLAEPFQGYRSAFESWYGQRDRRSLWEKARAP